MLSGAPCGEPGATDPTNVTEVEAKEAEWNLERIICKDRCEKLLGCDALLKHVPTEVYSPSETQFKALIEHCQTASEDILRKNVSERKDAAKRRNKWDGEKSYGRKASRRSKSNYVPPTTHIARPEDRGQYITKPREIPECFAEDWKEVYCTHPKENDIWNEFNAKYGFNIPRV